MELDVLEVQRRGARALGHGEAVPDRVPRVRRVQEEPPDAAGREDREVREDRVHPGVPVEDVRPEARVLERVALRDVGRVVAGRDEVDRRGLGPDRDVLLRLQTGEHRRLDRVAGRVRRVDDAGDRVGALAREVEVAAARARERHADVLQEDALHDLGPPPGEELDGLRAAEPRAGAQDVPGERGPRVTLAEVDDPALRPRGVALGGVRGLREDEDLHAAAREPVRRREARDAGAEDEDGDVEAGGEGVMGNETTRDGREEDFGFLRRRVWRRGRASHRCRAGRAGDLGFLRRRVRGRGRASHRCRAGHRALFPLFTFEEIFLFSFVSSSSLSLSSPSTKSSSLSSGFSRRRRGRCRSPARSA